MGVSKEKLDEVCLVDDGGIADGDADDLDDMLLHDLSQVKFEEEETGVKGSDDEYFSDYYEDMFPLLQKKQKREQEHKEEEVEEE